MALFVAARALVKGVALLRIDHAKLLQDIMLDCRTSVADTSNNDDSGEIVTVMLLIGLRCFRCRRFGQELLY